MHKFISRFRKEFDNSQLLLSALLLAAFIFYSISLSFDYTWLDDIYLIFSRNNELQSLDFSSLLFKDFFLLGEKTTGLFYRPLALLPWVIAAKISGTSLWFYHLENLLFHISAAGSLFFLLKKLGYADKASLAAVFIFLFHPISASVVGFTPNLSYPMLLTFLNISFIYGIEYLNNYKILPLLLHILFFLLGIFTLETALGFVPLFMFYAFYVFNKEHKAITKYTLKNYAVLCFAYASVFLLWFIIRRIAIGGEMQTRYFNVVWNNIPVLFASLQNFFLPFFIKPLSNVSFTFASIAFGLCVLIAIMLAPFFGYVKNVRTYILGFLFFMFFLLPSFLSGFEFNNMPHRIYIPSVGTLIMALEIDYKKLLPVSLRKLVFLLCALITACCGFIFLHYYENGEVFWNKVLKDNPKNALAYKQLVNTYKDEGRFDLAAKAALEFLETNPNSSEAQALYAINIGLSGLPKVAIEAFENLLAKDQNVVYRIAYAEFLAEQDMGHAAEAEYKKALKSQPDYMYGHFSYGNYFFSKSNWQNAEHEYRAALSKADKLNPIDEGVNIFRFKAQCMDNLSAVLIYKAASAKSDDSFLKLTQEAISLSPTAKFYEKIGSLLLNRKDFANAVKMYSISLEKDSKNSLAALGMALANFNLNNFEQTAFWLNRTLEIDPENAQAKLYLEEISRKLFLKQNAAKP